MIDATGYPLVPGRLRISATRVLGVVMFAMGVVALSICAFPPIDVQPYPVYVWSSVLMVALGVATFSLDGRLRRVHQHIGLAFISVFLGIAAGSTQYEDLFAAITPGLLAVGMFSAFFSTARAVTAHSAVAFACYAVGCQFSPVRPSFYSVVLTLVVLTSTLLVKSAITGDLLRRHATDPLTGVLTRAAWLSEAERAVEAGTGVSVAIVDLDKFKAVNDEFGHHAGDRMLQRVTLAWSLAIEGQARLGRFGGDEFVVLIRSTDLDDCARVIRRMARADPARWSYGLAVVAPGAEVTSALAAADRELLAKKMQRRTDPSLD